MVLNIIYSNLYCLYIYGVLYVITIIKHEEKQENFSYKKESIGDIQMAQMLRSFANKDLNQPL